MKQAIASLVAQAVQRLAGDALPDDAADRVPGIERTRDPRHGDFACNVAMMLAKAAGRPPREIASLIVDALPASPLVEGVDIAGPGFINFRLAPEAYRRCIAQILEDADSYGRSDVGAGQRVLVEFVSANPTGPLHVGHGRHAAYGDSVSNLLDATGHVVHREYYVNDAGRQMDILAVSVWLRYLEDRGQAVDFPANGYQGAYVRDIAAGLVAGHGNRFLKTADEVSAELPPDEPAGDKELHIDALIDRMRALLGEDDFGVVHAAGLEQILADIRQDLSEYRVEFDEWFSERRLTEDGDVARAIERLKTDGRAYEKNGALWFRATEFGDEKDRVVVRDNGQTTYIASDIAYHLTKRQRGNDVLLDVLGADHHGYVARLRAGLEAMDEPGDSLEVRVLQFAVLYRGGAKVQMSTRSGEFVTLRELRDEVGTDAARLFYVMRSNDQHLDFDLDLAKSRTKENPVYYIQYAHARVCNVFAKLAEEGLSWTKGDGVAALDGLTDERETALMRELSRFPEVVEVAAVNRAPQMVVHYLRDLANDFHKYYESCKFLIDDEALRNARLALISATRHVVANGLELVGVSAPERM